MPAIWALTISTKESEALWNRIPARIASEVVTRASMPNAMPTTNEWTDNAASSAQGRSDEASALLVATARSISSRTSSPPAARSGASG